MTPERFTQLADSYGGELQRWPVSLQSDARDCRAEHPGLRAVLKEAAQLDQALEGWTPPTFAGLEAQLLQQHLPNRHKGLIDRIADWLIPLSGTHYTSWWRPAAVACLPLLLGLATGAQFVNQGQRLFVNSGMNPVRESALNSAADSALELSLEEELYFISLSDYAENL